MDEWTQISFSFMLPHDAFLIGYEMIMPNEKNEWYCFQLHCFFITIRYEWGHGNTPYE